MDSTRRRRRVRIARFLAISALAAGIAAMGIPRSADPGRALRGAPLPEAARRLVGRSPSIPLLFVESEGDRTDGASFHSIGGGRSLHAGAGGIVLALDTPERTRLYLRYDFLDARPDCRPEGRDPASARISAFHGERAAWRTGLPTWRSLRYREVWPGIDAVVRGDGGRAKYEFHVRPGADPTRIRLGCRGVRGAAVNAAGALVLETGAGPIQDPRPVAWQPGTGARIEVDAAFDVAPIPPAPDVARDSEPTFEIRFRLGRFDPSMPLVVDPILLYYGGFLGGAGENFDSGSGSSSADDSVQAVAVGSDGSLFVAGWTRSTELSFPARIGPDATQNGGSDAFVAKLDPTGRELLWCGFLGGSATDQAFGIALENGEAPCVAGFTLSDETSFPLVVGPRLAYGGNGDAFVARIRPDGTDLDYCGYLGGSGTDYATSIAVENTGEAHVIGATNGDLPVRIGPSLALSGSYDAFVAKINAAGDDLVYAGYLGGIFDDFGEDIAVDPSGRAVVVGSTYSDQTTFPVVTGPDLTFNHPVAGFNTDAFVARVASDGASLEYCGYVGGLGWDLGYGVAVDSDSVAFLTGTTLSDEASFPVRIGPSLVYSGGSAIWGDAFVARVRNDGVELDWCGYLGGSDGDGGLDIAVDSEGRAHLAGITLSADFPVTEAGAPHGVFSGATDAFVACVAADGIGLVHSGYLGGTRADRANGLSLDLFGNAFVGGETASDQTTFPVLGGPDVTFNGGHPDQSSPTDGFVAKLVSVGISPLTILLEPASPQAHAGEDWLVDVTVANASTDPWTGDVWVEVFKPHRASWRGNPIAGPRQVPLGPGAWIRKTLRVGIPAAAPPGGPFLVRGSIGTWPGGPDDVAAVEFSIVE